MRTTYKRRAGFTLVEILIVVLVLGILFAILLPSVFSVMRKFNENAASIQIQRLEGHLEEYLLKERAYPTNEQGLFALVYIPDNVGTGGFQQTGMGQTGGMPGVDQSQQFEQSGGMLGGGSAVGPTDFSMNQQGMQNTMGTGGFDSTMGQQMTNPTTMDGMMSGSTWNQPVHNPQLYMQKRQRSAPYAKDEKQLLDPWGLHYRYDNSRDQYGLNPYTGEDRPAIWSMGSDKTEGTDDDIRNWEPAEAAQKRQEHMQRLQMQQQQMGGMMDGGMMGGGTAIGPGGMNDQMGFGGGMNMQPPGGMNMQSPGGMNMQPPGGMNMQSPGGMNMQSPGGMNMQSPGGMNMQPPGGMNMQPSGGMNMQPPGM